MCSLVDFEPVEVHAEKLVHIDVLSVIFIVRVLFKFLDNFSDMHVPFGHVCSEYKSEQFRRDALFKVPFHVSETFFRVLKVPLLFVNQVVTMEEVLLHEDVNTDYISFDRPSIVDFDWEVSRFVMLECFICLQEAGQLSVLLGPLPVIDEVLQRG